MSNVAKQAAAGGRGEPLSGVLAGRSAGGRREWAESPARFGGEFAPEIAFLVAQGFAPSALRQAAAAAERTGVSVEQALLGEGLISEEAYYLALARRLRLPFYRGEIAIAEQVDVEPAIACGVAPLAANRAGLRMIAAPRAAAIRYLIAKAEADALPACLAIAPPGVLNAMVRAGRARASPRRRPARWRAAIRRCAPASASAAVSARRSPVSRSPRRPPHVAASGALSLILSSILWSIFAAAIVLRNLAVTAAGRPSHDAPLDDAELPLYTIIAPLRGEERMVARLVRALDALDYPRGKLDIKLVVERDDAATLAAIASLALPARYELVVAPPGLPATKPRALNVALPSARGALRGRLRRRGRARSRPAPARRRAFRRRSRRRLPASGVDDRRRRGVVDRRDVRHRICDAVRSHRSRPRRARPADRARRHIQPLPRRNVAAGRRLGRLERHRGRRPRHAAGGVRRPRRRARLVDPRRSAG